VERAGTDDDDPEIGAALNLISLLCSPSNLSYASLCYAK
jgi:hypothetical protein